MSKKPTTKAEEMVRELDLLRSKLDDIDMFMVNMRLRNNYGNPKYRTMLFRADKALSEEECGLLYEFLSKRYHETETKVFELEERLGKL